ncbi:uncharacterized protein J3D65DRAFT_277768 [Phyllosticta citribraziliensis]|uniref:TPR-like protein n=1 Tax=Phyllosticta citribraziliensis TaxID=989973 RepID=A0ABR1LX92_9PEZI
MADVYLAFFQSTLPQELASSLNEHLQNLESGNFESVLGTHLTRALLGHQNDEATKDISLQNYNVWSDFIFRRLSALLEHKSSSAEHDHFRHHFFFVLALASLYSFIQSNVTGPPLPFSSTRTIFTEDVASDATKLSQTRQQLIKSLAVDGEGAYKLTPNPELFCLADTILSSPAIAQAVPKTPYRWAKLRLDFLHQRLLSEVAPSLQSSIYAELAELEKELLAPSAPAEVRVHFLLERAAVHTHHGFDKKAREDLERAKVERRFEFALTGLLGKRTKFQEKETSQLVVLARSADSDAAAADESKSKDKGKAVAVEEDEQKTTKPKNLDLNDDTLLESISFSEEQPAQSSTDVLGEDALPQALAELDAGNQPMLDPLDSVILLLLASSISNMNPDNGLTREETAPYATRVLEGGSSNWQVYTQALLVRSRIEGYRPRTMERGLLQLQAVVDQVIADTTSADATPNGSAAEGAATTFLPRSKEDESAPVSERLRFVFTLCSPSRWELESELAERWVKLGGLRTALEIFERLEMWAEAALCWAATEREDKAKKVVRKQLFHATNGDDEAAGDEEKWEGAPREPVPTDAPRLYCILGDIDQDPAMYEKGWEVSGNRYARAQRSLGRFWMHANDNAKAADAYRKSLRVNQLNNQSWFALGCAYLEMAQFERAVEAFTRVVQLDDQDAEAWSNLAAALLRLEPSVTVSDDDVEKPAAPKLDDEEDDDPGAINLVAPRRDPQQHIRDALKALKHAARLKHDNHRIWDNLLTVAASLNPPAFNELLSAQRRLIELRGATDGEACVDATILEALARHVAATHDDGFDPTKPGLARMLVKLVDEAVVPLITASAPLWRVVARLALWRGRPSAALEAHEKAWRAVTSQPGWETTTEARWDEVVEATVELVDAYETLGPREKTEGLAAGSGALVAKDWRFKARTAVKGICGRARDAWEGTEGWERLRERLEDLKG